MTVVMITGKNLMLYIFTAELNGVEKVVVTSLDPDANDYEDVLSNSFIATVVANVVRNILNGK